MKDGIDVPEFLAFLIVALSLPILFVVLGLVLIKLCGWRWGGRPEPFEVGALLLTGIASSLVLFLPLVGRASRTVTGELVVERESVIAANGLVVSVFPLLLVLTTLAPLLVGLGEVHAPGPRRGALRQALRWMGVGLLAAAIATSITSLVGLLYVPGAMFLLAATRRAGTGNSVRLSAPA